MSDILRIARKELAAFFGSPVAYIFIGSFLAVCLFVFFWVSAFFARNIADTRPLFEWMPVLLIFLCAALTMRLWSEERRAGTLETLLTLPVPTWRLVAGKFLAALTLVAIALALTLPLPLTVAVLGPLDWGPVVGAYVATLMLAAAYLAIGLFVSSRTDNPIVALIGSVLVCALFYLLGSDALTNLFGNRGGEVLRLLGSGSRFDSITRGVIDLRDLYYYLSIVGTFLALTVYSLERLRWAPDTDRPEGHRRLTLITGLAVANLLAANLWLTSVDGARTDLTQGRVYSISDATRTYLGQLQEPLLIRGYFSAQTHPLLAPLVPQIRDLLKEYQIAGGGRVRVEFVDPADHPDLEREAGEQYGIHPVAFQTASKYQAGVVNSYFDLVVKYGDQFEHLGFQDLIEVKVRGETELDVRLRNPEYDLTRAIKKVLYGYQGGGDLFAGLKAPVKLRAFVSAPAQLPAPLPTLRTELEALLNELQAKSNGRFSFEVQDPGADKALARAIEERYGFKPLVVDLLKPTPFYFYLALESNGRTESVPLPESLDKAGLQRTIEAGIKRFAPGVLRTLAVYTPPQIPGEFGMPAARGPAYGQLEQRLRDGFTLQETDLKSGQVPADADLLLVLGPENLDQKQQFAIDQFLMQGGTALVAAATFKVDLGRGGISARPQATGLEDWLATQGLTLGKSLVLDPQNTPFPIPVQRNLGGYLVEEVQTLDYPYFPDVREGGLAADSGITSNLGQITMNWSSPIEVDQDKTKGRTVTTLIRSSSGAWTSDSATMQPDFKAHGDLGFARGKDRGTKVLGLVMEGRFNSAFAGQPSPLLTAVGDKQPPPDEPDEAAATPGTPDAKPAVVSGVIESSPSSARLILLGSASFLTDTAIGLASEATQTRYDKPIELIQNAVEWSLEDRGLLALRGRGQFSRLLVPLSRQGRIFYEYLNYALALGGVGLLYWLARRARTRRDLAQARYLTNPEGRA
ncbi:Gldg family protein [uncultured Thiodictyon sp.]|jgi:ABC-2 type transport system permease protein|uniref:Gldg family protein n=1 Tax=uncultured Thiodictyon sp. TaxID=1846217 RepID=UPI0025CE0DA4|nr:Gldg family protein [uncultured Thiodictyon sp.]